LLSIAWMARLEIRILTEMIRTRQGTGNTKS
jgi:hypothetical protein